MPQQRAGGGVSGGGWIDYFIFIDFLVNALLENPHKNIKKRKFSLKHPDKSSKMGLRMVNHIIFIRKINGAVKKFI